MRIVLAVVVSALALPASADEASRRAATEIVAEAGALGVLCSEEQWALSKDIFKSLWITSGFVLSEVSSISTKISEKIDQLQRDKIDRTIICRDAREKYGPSGTVIPNLLVPLGDPRAFD